MRYSPSSFVKVTFIGNLTRKCEVCNALCYPNERKGICCNGGKVRLQLPSTTPLLHDLLTGYHPSSQHFRKNIRQFNGLFSFTSFLSNIQFMSDSHGNRQWTPSFKILGQLYHRIGSLFPSSHGNEKFMQIYFLGRDEQLSRRRSIFEGIEPSLIEELSNMLHQFNPYVNQFQTAMSTIRQSQISNLKVQYINISTNQILPPTIFYSYLHINLFYTSNVQVIIRDDMVPAGEHPGRYNSRTMNNSEVAILFDDENVGPRDIIITQSDSSLRRISELHHSYDPLQYPLLLPGGEPGYHITSSTTCMKQYSYLLMVHLNFHFK